MLTSEYCCSVFLQVIETFHTHHDVDVAFPFPVVQDDIHHILQLKSWIDTVQWHLEDIIRKPDLPPNEFIQIKRRIDTSNQERTDLVERMDDWFSNQFDKVTLVENPRINTETPAWAIDRLSILMLKIYHMQEQTLRTDADKKHIETCVHKLDTLLMQKADLCFSLNALIHEIAEGKTRMKTYRQMKMYNDPATNPELYNKK
jgi:hypothetical protein